jgi:hypothetical protein
MLFDAHTRCLTGLGGVAGRGIYDNMKTAVDLTPRKDRGRVVNARFAAMAAHYLFEPDFCNVASGWEKGRVEKSVQDTRRRIWQEAQHQRFASFAELNAWLPTQCLAAWEAPHPELTGVTIREAWTQERPQLMPMPTPFDGYVEVPARVSSTSLVSVARNRYSVPCAWAGHRVSVRLYPERVVIVADHHVVAEHTRATDRDQVVYAWQHYLPLVERKPGRCATAPRLPTSPIRCSACAAPCSSARAATKSWPACSWRSPRMAWMRCSSPSNWCSRVGVPAPIMGSTSSRGSTTARRPCRSPPR